MKRNKLIEWDDSILSEPRHGEKARQFKCSECSSVYGVIDKIQKSQKEYCKCPNCKNRTLESYILGPTMVQVKDNITTVGQLADYNTKKLGRYEKEEKDRAFTESETTARKTIKAPDKAKAEKVRKLSKMTPEQTKRYIYTGEGL